MWDRIFASDMLIFTIPAIVGGAIFILRLSLMMLGGVGDVGTDMDVDVDMDIDADALDADGSTDAFTVLSIQALAAFAMGFGTGGLAARIGMGWDALPSIAAGIGFGAFMLWILGLMMKAIYDLESSGNVGIKDCVGSEAVVYAAIPEHGNGVGQVRVVVGNRLRIYKARSDGPAMSTQTTVRVTGTNGDNSLNVTPLSA